MLLFPPMYRESFDNMQGKVKASTGVLWCFLPRPIERLGSVHAHACDEHLLWLLRSMHTLSEVNAMSSKHSILRVHPSHSPDPTLIRHIT